MTTYHLRFDRKATGMHKSQDKDDLEMSQKTDEQRNKFTKKVIKH